MINQKTEIEICINLINWFENISISNEEVFKRIEDNEYVKISQILDEQRKEQGLKDIHLHKRLTSAIEDLKNANPKYEIHIQRYRSFSFLSFLKLVKNSCTELQVPTDEMIDYFSKAEYHILQSELTQFVISKLLEKDDVKTSLSLIPRINDKNEHYTCYRLIAHYYGQKADKLNFLKWLKKCDARKDVGDIQAIKSIFVSKYAETNSLDEALKIVDSKGFGKMYLTDALLPFTKTKSFNEIKEIINIPRFETKKEYLQQIILTNSFINNKTNQTINNFNELSEILMEIPSRVRWYPSDASLRDNLWSYIAESLINNNKEKFKTQIDFTIKKINAKWLKKSIKEQI